MHGEQRSLTVSAEPRARASPLMRRIMMVMVGVTLAATITHLVILQVMMRFEAEADRALISMEEARSQTLSLALRVEALRDLAHDVARERDPETAARLSGVFQGVVDHVGGCNELSCHDPATRPAAMVEEMQRGLVPIGDFVRAASESTENGALEAERDRVDQQVVTMLGDLQMMNDELGLRVVENRADVRRYHTRFEGLSFAALLIVATAVLILSYWLARRITAPLLPLVDATRRVARGDFDFELEVEGRDELASLAGAFNDMATQLRDLHHAQEQYASRLEEEVECRIDDILERDQLLKQSERLANMGIFVGGVAHEINNPLTGILMNTALLNEEGWVAPQGSELLAEIDRAATGCKVVVDKLLELATMERIDAGQVDLDQVVQQALENNEVRISERSIRLSLRMPEPSPQVAGDPERLLVVVDNLIRNAVDACADGGRIEVRGESQNGSCRLSVADSGSGIDEGFEDRVFEPFFTTRRAGSGLGLPVCRRVMERMGGGLDVLAGEGLREDGGGATFIVTLPMWREHAQQAEC
jgi:signal transduction histidine kinase